MTNMFWACDEVTAGRFLEDFEQLDLLNGTAVLRIATDNLLHDVAETPRDHGWTLDALRDAALATLRELMRIRPDDEELQAGLIRALIGNGAAIIRSCGCGHSMKWRIDEPFDHAHCDGEAEEDRRDDDAESLRNRLVRALAESGRAGLPHSALLKRCRVSAAEFRPVISNLIGRGLVTDWYEKTETGRSAHHYALAR